MIVNVGEREKEKKRRTFDQLREWVYRRFSAPAAEKGEYDEQWQCCSVCCETCCKNRRLEMT